MWPFEACNQIKSIQKLFPAGSNLCHRKIRIRMISQVNLPRLLVENQRIRLHASDYSFALTQKLVAISFADACRTKRHYGNLKPGAIVSSEQVEKGVVV